MSANRDRIPNLPISTLTRRLPELEPLRKNAWVVIQPLHDVLRREFVTVYGRRIGEPPDAVAQDAFALGFMKFSTLTPLELCRCFEDSLLLVANYLRVIARNAFYGYARPGRTDSLTELDGGGCGDQSVERAIPDSATAAEIAFIYECADFLGPLIKRLIKSRDHRAVLAVIRLVLCYLMDYQVGEVRIAPFLLKELDSVDVRAELRKFIGDIGIRWIDWQAEPGGMMTVTHAAGRISQDNRKVYALLCDMTGRKPSDPQRRPRGRNNES